MSAWKCKQCGHAYDGPQRPCSECYKAEHSFAAPPCSAIPRDKWEWYGHAAHFCCGRWCRFHMATKVGMWLISSVGEYVHPRHSGESEKTEAEWLRKNHPGEDIGYGRKYETMVFEVQGTCECGCGLPTISGSEIEADGYNDAKSATAGHHAMCERVASWPNSVLGDPCKE